MLGLTNGISRFIGYYIGSGEKFKIKEIEVWGIILGVISGIFFGAILFIIAPYIAPIFSENELFIGYLKIAAITIPFYTILTVLISIFRGHHRAQEKIFFYDVGRNLLFFLFSFLTGIFALPFVGIIWSMFLSTGIMSISIVIYYLINQKTILKRLRFLIIKRSIGKKILLFSLPLLFVDILHKIMEWSDTLMLGYFSNEKAVGFYNIARPMSVFISIGLSISLFIYTPLTAGLYAQKKLKENVIIFTTITKWICFFTLPIAILFFFYGSEIISIFFGEKYLPAVNALKILVVVYFIHNIMGPNGATLTAYGKTKYLLFTGIISSLLNVVLNFLIIPLYGIVGAAIATGISIIFINLIRVYYLKKISNIHPFRFEIIIPVTIASLLGIIFSLFFIYFSFFELLSAIIVVIITPLSFLFTMILTKNISSQDKKLFYMIESKIGINLYIIKKLLKKFF